MIVVDASVLVNALTDDGALGDAARGGLDRDLHWAAPEHLIVESFSAVRGRHIGGKVSALRAADALDAVREASIELVSTQPLLPRMWALRENVSGYDAGYVAAAEAFECLLVTADRRLAHTGVAQCGVRVALPPV